MITLGKMCVENDYTGGQCVFVENDYTGGQGVCLLRMITLEDTVCVENDYTGGQGVFVENDYTKRKLLEKKTLWSGE